MHDTMPTAAETDKRNAAVQRELLEDGISRIVESTPGSGRPTYVYEGVNTTALLRVTQIHGGMDESWDVEVAEYPTMASKYDDGWRYLANVEGPAARQILRATMVHYFGSAR
jgi:hypothetical protein